MQQQFMPFGWPIPAYLPLPPIIEDNDLFINSIVNGATPVPGPQGEPGPAGPQGEPGSQGAAGVGVATAEVTPNPGDLLLMLTDGTVINAGNVVGPAGPQGTQGQQGPVGPQGPAGSTICSTITITGDYTATSTDCYIGAQLKEAATLTLPNTVSPGTEYKIKLEYGAPVGNRKLTVKPQAPALINGVTAITLTNPYDSLSVIYNNNHYWTI